MKYSLLFLIIWTPALLRAQTIKQFESELKPLGQKILKAKTEGERIEANNEFKRKFKKALELSDSFKYNFDSLETVSKAFSDDEKLKIYTWLMPNGDGTFQYFGFVQTVSGKSNKLQLFELTDQKSEIKNPYLSLNDYRKWGGCIYYKCITNKYRKKYYYTLLGWEGYTGLSTRKIIEPVVIGSRGEPRFGDARFRDANRGYRRIVFEYSEQASMSLKYYPATQEIIFDHLSPPEPQLKDQYQYYGPDFTYDEYYFEKGKWIWKKEVTPRNDKTEEKQGPKVEKITDDKMYKPKK